jgi:hypothetical protein
MPDTPLGFITGKVTIERLPAAPTGLQIRISAGATDPAGHGAEVYVQPSPNGSDYSIPLFPGNYKVFAQFGSAVTPAKDATVTNGRPTEVNFAFGK